MVLLSGTNYLGWSMLKWTSYECNFELAELRARSQGWPSHFGRRRALMNFAPKDTSGKLNLSFTPSFLSKQSKTLIAVGCVSYLHLLGQIRDLRPIAKTFDGAAGGPRFTSRHTEKQKTLLPNLLRRFDDDRWHFSFGWPWRCLADDPQAAQLVRCSSDPWFKTAGR